MGLERADQKLAELLIRQNKTRMTLIAAVVLVVQLCNAFDDRTFSTWYILACVGLITLSSLAYLVISYLFRKREYGCTPRMQTYNLVYWCVLLVSVGSFVLADAFENGLYINVWILYGLMVFAPAANIKEFKRLSALALVVAVLPVVAVSANILKAVITIGVGVSCALLGIMLHSGYHQAMRAIRLEGDMDGLTRLLSKTAGISRMAALMSMCRRMGRSVAFYYIDIDHFKSYNDTYGHLSGDEALARVADCIRKCFTREADILCRLGGEEFAVLIPVADGYVALKMGQKLSRAVTNMGMRAGVASKHEMVSVSIGLAICTPHARNKATVEELMEEADKQLYIAKSQGRNCIAMADAVVFRNK